MDQSQTILLVMMFREIETRQIRINLIEGRPSKLSLKLTLSASSEVFMMSIDGLSVVSMS